MAENLKYKRILLKLGGEALGGADGAGIDPLRAAALAQKLEAVLQLGAQIAVVIGGGNLWRGREGMEFGI